MTTHDAFADLRAANMQLREAIVTTMMPAMRRLNAFLANLSTPARKGQEGAEAGNKPPTGGAPGGRP